MMRRAGEQLRARDDASAAEDPPGGANAAAAGSHDVAAGAEDADGSAAAADVSSEGAVSVSGEISNSSPTQQPFEALNFEAIEAHGLATAAANGLPSLLATTSFGAMPPMDQVVSHACMVSRHGCPLSADLAASSTSAPSTATCTSAPTATSTAAPAPAATHPSTSASPGGPGGPGVASSTAVPTHPNAIELQKLLRPHWVRCVTRSCSKKRH